MKYVTAVGISLLCALISYVTLNQELSNKTKLLRPSNSDESECKIITAKKRYIICIGVCLCSLGATIMMASNEIGWLNYLKMSVGLLCLSGAACNDYRDHRIPNVFPLVMAVSAVAFLAIGFFSSQDGATDYIFSSVFAAIVVAVLMIIASLLTKRGIGMGDIKLLTALALLGGVYTIGWTLIFGVAFCGVVAVILLITKKKTVKGTMPFGPFIFVGYIITIVLNKY